MTEVGPPEVLKGTRSRRLFVSAFVPRQRRLHRPVPVEVYVANGAACINGAGAVPMLL